MFYVASCVFDVFIFVGTSVIPLGNLVFFLFIIQEQCFLNVIDS
jgi:hypothetical protein